MPLGGRAASRRARADAMDARIRQLLDGAVGSGAGPALALVAVGGYGRAELSPHSDVDVVLVHDEDCPADVVDAVATAVWYPLWDAGIKLDHAVRSAEQMRQSAAKDIRTALGLLDLRHVAGAASLTRLLRSEILAQWRSQARVRLPELASMAEQRAQVAGELAHEAVPDLNESRGGLSDGVVMQVLVAGWLSLVPHSVIVV